MKTDTRTPGAWFHRRINAWLHGYMVTWLHGYMREGWETTWEQVGDSNVWPPRSGEQKVLLKAFH